MIQVLFIDSDEEESDDDDLKMDDKLTNSSLAKQQQIAKLFRFGTPKEIEIWEQSVALNKYKSQGDNPTNQRLNHNKHRKKLNKVRRNLQSLKIKSETAKNLRKKRLHQQIKKRELLDFNWHENTPDDLKQTIK